MAQKNRDYWEERQVKREAKAFSTIQDIEKEYKIALEKAKQNINKELSRIGTTYMKDNNLSYHDALKLLKGDEYKVWKKDLHDYLKEYNKLLKTAPLEAKKLYLEIETLSARSRLSHLDSLKAQVDMEMVKLIFGVEDSAKNALTSVYRDTFIEITKDLGINAIVSRDKIKAVLDRPWSGANFSERLWSNTDKLAQTVKQEIVNGMIQGINLQTVTKRVSERFETAKKNDVERLLRTEVNYTLNQATLDGYKEAGIEKYEFNATLDSRTSQICSELHGEVFEIKKIAVGLNYPPMHPRCRSTTIPIIDYENLIKQGREEIGGKDIESNEKEALTNNENKSITKEPVPNTFTMAWAQNDKVEYNEVRKLQKELTTEEIIKKLGGGDQTKGSCSSLAFAYIGNRNGYDVLDFRGGISTEIFATTRNIVEIANLDGIESKVIKRANDYNAVKELLTFVEEKKEYYLETGKHAAIIRIGNRGFEYLELQSETENGFKKLDSSVLKTRFGCQTSYSVGGIKFEKSNVLIEVDSCKNSEEFKNLLGYINTAKDKQNKGESGYAK
ncbi:minor capsid protein [Fusobacterium polymorphum]|uniref:minor capsid protein n=1 Tax=Fusobacterium nucleatum subsp. polymorphum TaxID=76857 RepID=UPI0021C2E61F|nr:minor capsid protein [Fusobacterium polymorphum]